MIEILTAAAALILAVLAGIERVRRKNLEKKMQDEIDLLNSDPLGWVDSHFGGVPKPTATDNSASKTDDPGI